MVPELGDGGEFGRFIKVWCTVFSSLTYCYYIARNVPKGFPRLCSVLPIVYVFSLLPLNLTSIHLTIGAGFFISWLANLKLFLFCFDAGPLSSNPLPVLPSSTSSMTLLRFLAIACLPIKIKQSNPSSFSSSSSSSLFLVMYAALARLVFDLEVEPPFGNFIVIPPSFHEFWGRRWNRVVSSLLRSLVYEPVRRITKRSWGIYVAILATFFVSGLMHELMIFYIGRELPRGGLLVFFMLQGIGMSVEIYLKRTLNRKWKLNRLVSQLMLPGFLLWSVIFYMDPSLGRIGVGQRVNEEIACLIKLLKDILIMS
ncbi:hypothetical protein MKW94_006623 [Papaver nudicaule]|uniref:Wax synthase domain-containing protein n=1 Tax=Papaver nudicaule TaxID=74823 RepID=A0AA41SDI5_PAPNU|nr:hypothetical protein [Papaver nudicaule]